MFSSRASAAGAEEIKACRESIATTTVDLEIHLEDILQKLEVLTQRTAAGPNPDTAAHHHMEEERRRTEKALQFCTLLSQQIEKIQADYFEDGQSPGSNQDSSSNSGMLLSEGLEGCLHHMRFTLASLEKHQRRVSERLGADPMAASAEDQALFDKLQTQAKTLRRSLEFASDVDAFLETQISNIENHAEGDDTIQFMVSTNGKPLNGINRGKGRGVKQGGGNWNDESLQQVSQDFKSIALHQNGFTEHGTRRSASVPGDDTASAVPDSLFGSRHGPGFKLAKHSPSSAPAGPAGV